MVRLNLRHWLVETAGVTMRGFVNSVFVLLAGAIIVGLVLGGRHLVRRWSQERTVRISLNRLDEQIAYHRALQANPDSPRQARFPAVLRPRWFDEHLPVNVLVEPGRPWLDIAPPGDMHKQPPDPVCTGDAAGFWYNPNRGIVRARVEAQGSQAQTLALYNRLNHAHLSSLSNLSSPETGPEQASRNPEPFRPAMVSSKKPGLTTSPAEHRGAVRNPF